MNVILLCSLICLGSCRVFNQLAPLKKIMNKSLITIAPLKKMANKQLIDVIMDHQKDPAYLLSVLSNVDPTQLNAVIVLIKALLAASESDLAALNLASTNANTAYTDATVAYEAAVLAKSTLVTAYGDANVLAEKHYSDANTVRETAYTAESVVLDQQVNDLFVVQSEANGAKKNAQDTLDAERIRLNGEIETLIQVIALLEGLQGTGSWELGMNINPCDGGNMGYGGPWASGGDVGTAEQAFTNDFISDTVWQTPASYITIARHSAGQCTMSKTWELTDKTQSMYDYFTTYPGRIYATGDGSINDNHIASDISLDAEGQVGQWKDPIFGADGGLVFNWWYSNNGARIAVPGGYKTPYTLPGTGDNNDDVHGLGNEFGATTQSGGGSNEWWHDVAKTGPDCHGGSCQMVGTDHGTSLSDGSCWGSYAIYISTDATSFGCAGKELSHIMG